MRRLLHPMVLFAAVLYVFPYLVVALGKSAFNASEFLVWAIFALGLNLLWGHTGDLSFGHGMFFGWGAYTAGIMSRHVTSVPVDLAAAAGVAMLVAWPLAKIIVRRATGIYFAMITLAIGEMFFFIAFRITSITGGENGLGDIRLSTIGGLDLTSNANFYYMVATVTFLCALVAWRITRSPFGQVCRAIQQNRGRVPFLGFDTVRYRERAFVWSAGICGVAGGLSAFLFRHVAADTLRWTTTGQAVLMTMLGGLNSFFGPAAGAVSVKFMEASLNTVTKYWPAYIGGVFAAFVLVAPSGLAGLAGQVRALVGSPVRRRGPSGAGRPGAEDGGVTDEATIALRTIGLSKSFRGLEVLRGVDLSVTTGTLHAVIGPNGAGKTTLFNILSGALPPTGGRVELRGRDVTGKAPHELARLGLSWSFQVTSVFPALTVEENLAVAAMAGQPRQSGILRRPKWTGEVTARVETLLDQLGLTALRGLEAGVLSHGDQRRLDIGLTLASEPSIILLDEPTAGMTRAEAHQTMGSLEQILGGRTIVLVEHDMDLVMRISSRVSVLHRGILIADGPPEEVRENPEVREAYLVGIGRE